MTLPDKATLMAWCRVDDEEAGAVLEQLCAQAAAYLTAAGVLPPRRTPERSWPSRPSPCTGSIIPPAGTSPPASSG